MNRRPSGSDARREERPAVPAHHGLLEHDLESWAGAGVARGGRRDALLGKVESIELSYDGRRVEARVRGNRPSPHRVRVGVGADDVGPLVSECTCPDGAREGCRHAVAALVALRFPARDHATGAARRRVGRTRAGAGRIIQRAAVTPGFMVLGGAERVLGRDDRVALARDSELALRRQRARRERARVVRLDAGDGVPRVRVVPRRGGAPATVSLHGPDVRHAVCDCEDFRTAELRTCSHVERYRIWIRRVRKAERPVVPDDLVSVYCLPLSTLDRPHDALEEIRLATPDARGDARPAPWFDDRGRLRRPPAGVDGTAWADEAIERARGAAWARGLRVAVEPEVERRLRRARESTRGARGRARLDRDPRLLADVESSLRLRLHPYQRVGVQFLARAGRGFLADDMGLGKTVQAVAAALALRRTSGARRALVVCPASLKHQWAREIEKVCGERATVVAGRPAERARRYADRRDGFTILNYELVLRDIDRIVEHLPELVILDEAQRIKNWSTKTARAVKRLRATHAFVLTGTPLENRLAELHSLVEFLHPRALGPRWRLAPFHTVTDETGRVVAYEGLELLRRRLTPFFLRRDRAGVLDELPERTEHTFWTGMTALQRRHYRRHAATASAILGTGTALHGGQVRALLRALTTMRMLCNAHAQYAWASWKPRLEQPEPPTPAELRALGSPKLEEFRRVVDDLLDDGSSKLVVFSQWERMLRLASFVVRDLLVERGLRDDVFHGGLAPGARVAMLDAFRDDPELRILFSTDAGGLGLNLQESASIVINLEVPWNPAVLDQRVGRVHRLGQRRGVRVLEFVTGGAVEERVRRVVADKRALFDGLLVDGADQVTLDAGQRASFLDRVRRVVHDPRAGSLEA